MEYPHFMLINFNVLLDEHTSYYVTGGSAPVLTPPRPEFLKDDEEVEDHLERGGDHAGRLLDGLGGGASLSGAAS